MFLPSPPPLFPPTLLTLLLLPAAIAAARPLCRSGRSPASNALTPIRRRSRSGRCAPGKRKPPSGTVALFSGPEKDPTGYELAASRRRWRLSAPPTAFSSRLARPTPATFSGRRQPRREFPRYSTLTAVSSQSPTCTARIAPKTAIIATSTPPERKRRRRNPIASRDGSPINSLGRFLNVSPHPAQRAGRSPCRRGRTQRLLPDP